jgi:hypothetical protein
MSASGSPTEWYTSLRSLLSMFILMSGLLFAPRYGRRSVDQ